MPEAWCDKCGTSLWFEEGQAVDIDGHAGCLVGGKHKVGVLCEDLYPTRNRRKFDDEDDI